MISCEGQSKLRRLWACPDRDLSGKGIDQSSRVRYCISIRPQGKVRMAEGE